MHECEYGKNDEDMDGQCGDIANQFIELSGSDKHWFCVRHYDMMATTLKKVSQEIKDDLIAKVVGDIVKHNKL